MADPQKSEPKPSIPDDITEMACLNGKEAMKDMYSVISGLNGDDETIGASKLDHPFSSSA